MEQNHAPPPGKRENAALPKMHGNMHLLEGLLWRQLRSRPSGLRFNRRRATGKYVHDFYCPDARLAIELDASTVDPVRDDWLKRAGIATMRITAKHIIEESGAAADEIVSRARALLPQSHPALAVERTPEAS